MSALLVEGGRVVDPGSGVEEVRDLWLVEGRVAAGPVPDAERLDARGLVVAPGLIDIHVHLREPGQGWKETIATGTRAAAAGGFTTVCAMPNTSPVTDTPEWVRWVQAPERGAVVRVLPVGAATVGSLGSALTDYAALKAAGAVAVSDDGKPVLEDEVMRAALKAGAAAGLPVVQHAEDTRLTRGASMNAGARAFRMGLRGMPVEAEAGIVERDIGLVRELRAEGVEAGLHVQHVSTEQALDLVRVAKREGLRVTCEVAPHHFALNESAVEGYATLAKMNPPLRAERDRAAMVAGLLDGTVDCIATDHAPHASWEKEQEFERAPNGITGLETALGLAVRVLHRECGMGLSGVLELMTAGPARVLGLAGGSLGVGSLADVVVLDPHALWTYATAESVSRSRNSPFEGWEMRGRVRWTICGGRIVYRG